MSVRKGENALVCYTSDTALLESDLFLMQFIKGNADALVMEDADHILQPRSNGNSNLHRLLVVADGVARAKGRKLIFSTNLPNLGDLDDALLRPGRCYARVVLPELTSAQAERFFTDFFTSDEAQAKNAWTRLMNPAARTHSLAKVYQSIERGGPEPLDLLTGAQHGSVTD
jgi:SpoVK/Ycf46/Vps4 family AAA+-type ATPase